jgi:hypothetical protein
VRRSPVFFLFVSFCFLIITGLFIESQRAVSRFGPAGRDLAELTSSLKLTDISFTNDARYARNPSQADLFSAFQDYPGSIEHFPSGSIIAPPDFGSIGTRLIVVSR